MSERDMSSAAAGLSVEATRPKRDLLRRVFIQTDFVKIPVFIGTGAVFFGVLTIGIGRFLVFASGYGATEHPAVIAGPLLCFAACATVVGGIIGGVLADGVK